VEQKSSDPYAKAIAFANGLRKSVAASGRRWSQFPGGANDLAAVVAAIDGVAQRLQSTPEGDEGEAPLALCIAELRAILEWTTYQSGSIATAKALATARKTRAFAQRFGLLDDPAAGLAVLTDSEEWLIENVRLKNEYMETLARKYPHLELPRPLVRLESLAPKVEKKPGKLDLIQQLTKSAKKKK
jgi:hypothetical protein